MMEFFRSFLILGFALSSFGQVLVNEIDYNSAAANADFIELYNPSPTDSVDVSNWRLEGVDVVLPAGTTMPPGSFLILAEDSNSFQSVHGALPVAAEFANPLDDNGGRLRLSDAAGNLVEMVQFDDDAPWPVEANGFGASLQRIDAGQSGIRPGNWGVDAAVMATPFATNSIARTLPDFPDLWLNEVQPSEGWVELYSASFAALGGLYLSEDMTDLDQQPLIDSLLSGWLRVPLSIDPAAERVALTAFDGVEPIVLDVIEYRGLLPSQSFGSFPDGAPLSRQRFDIPTPNAANNPAVTPGAAVFNEWMARNDSTLADPADGDFEDWFELYNPGDTAVDLSGYTISDDPTDPAKFVLPAGTVLAADDHLLIWADKEEAQGPLHAGFDLDDLGETITLYQPDGTRVDQVTFGPQSGDVAEGSWKDGLPPPFYALGMATPDAPNLFAAPNEAPTIAHPGDQIVTEDQLLSLQIVAADTNAPPQTLSYSLGAGAPPGLTLHPGNGQLNWIPSELQGPTTYPITVLVSDDHNIPATTLVTFNIQVLEGNSPPEIAPIPDQSIDELQLFSLLPTASDPDIPTQPFTWSLGPGSPAGMTINAASGRIEWTPSEMQGPGTATIELRVSDGIDSNRTSFVLTIEEVNQPPVIVNPGGQAIHLGETFQISANATDPDIPAQTLTYSLPNAPAGATIDPVSGAITWTAAAGDQNQFRTFTVRVEDDGSPALAATNIFWVFVADPITATIRYEPTNMVATVSWNSLPGSSYEIEATTPDLTGMPVWSAIGQVTATGTSASFAEVCDPAVRRKFYRVRRL